MSIQLGVLTVQKYVLFSFLSIPTGIYHRLEESCQFDPTMVLDRVEK
jgi:hypothetical protein